MSGPVAGSPAERSALLSPHETHALSFTFSFTPQVVIVHVVSELVNGVFAACVDPGAHGKHSLSLTYSFNPHFPTKQVVSLPEAFAPGAAVLPCGQFVHSFDTTF